MSKRFARPRRTRRDTGYALLLTVFLTTILLLTALVAAPSVRTERQRQKEEEMIWRGKQYVRAIKLYYRKTGRFPTSLDDLIKPKNGSLRFLRQAYKDPMNKTDGTWRLIYVGPAGQLVGSLKPPQTLKLSAFGGAQVGTPAAALANPNAQPGQPGATTQPGATAIPGATPTGAAGSTPASASASADSGAASDAAPPLTDTPSIIGGNIIGIGSKIDKHSVIIYEKAKNYRLFEFVWDPSKDVMAVGGRPGTQIGTPIAPQQGLGQTGFGQSGFGPGRGGQGGFGTQPGGFGTQPTNNPMGQPNMPPLAPNQPQPQPQQ
jgi:type II secretory pathway pseudopilin PulG